MAKKHGEPNRDRLIRLLSERLEIPIQDVVERFPFIDDIDISDYDSLDLVEFAMEIEEEFGKG